MKLPMKALPKLIIGFFFLLSQGYPRESCANQKESVILITGASGEIGSCIVESLFSKHPLILLGKTPEKLFALKEKFQPLTPFPIDTIPIDFSHEVTEQLSSLTQKLADSKISGLVLITPRPSFDIKKSLFLNEKEWQKLFQKTFSGPSAVITQCLPYMKRSASIVIIAGTSAVQLQPQYELFSVIRKMWTTYAKTLSFSLGERDIRINVISPGELLTHPRMQRIKSQAEKKNIPVSLALQEASLKIPLKRMGTTEDVSNAVLFLLGNDASFITGAHLLVDGGFTTTLP